MAEAPAHPLTAMTVAGVAKGPSNQADFSHLMTNRASHSVRHIIIHLKFLLQNLGASGAANATYAVRIIQKLLTRAGANLGTELLPRKDNY